MRWGTLGVRGARLALLVRKRAPSPAPSSTPPGKCLRVQPPESGNPFRVGPPVRHDRAIASYPASLRANPTHTVPGTDCTGFGREHAWCLKGRLRQQWALTTEEPLHCRILCNLCLAPYALDSPAKVLTFEPGSVRNGASAGRSAASCDTAWCGGCRAGGRRGCDSPRFAQARASRHVPPRRPGRPRCRPNSQYLACY